jgi:hypothetical protein
MFTQAAIRPSTKARAMRRASAALEQVTRTTNLSVKAPPSPLLFLDSRNSGLVAACLPRYNTAGDASILFATGRWLHFWPAEK